MLARLHSVTLEGIEGIVCEVEVDVSRGGLERPVIVGLPDAAVKESIERVRSAIVNSGYRYPDTQALVNLAPADVKKAGPAFDLPIALLQVECEWRLLGPDGATIDQSLGRDQAPHDRESYRVSNPKVIRRQPHPC